MEELNVLIAEFTSTLDQAVAKSAWEVEEPTPYLTLLADQIGRIEQAAVAIGVHSHEQLMPPQSLSAADTFRYQTLTYLWPDRVKELLILWRDVQFQYQKALVLVADERILATALATLRERSHHTLVQAHQDLQAFIEKEVANADIDRKWNQRQMAKWKLQLNPWPEYRQQLELLVGQSQDLLLEFDKLQKIENEFDQIRRLIEQTIQSTEVEASEIAATANTAHEYIAEQTQSEQEPKPGKVASYLEDLENAITTHPHQSIFSERLEKQVAQLPEKMQVTIDTDEGMLSAREFNFKRRIRQWLESEILPLLYEVWELTEKSNDGLKMSLINIRNRALLLATEIREGRMPDIEQEDLIQPLRALEKKVAVAQEDLGKLEQAIHERMERNFQLSGLYTSTDTFLPVPLQSTIKKLNLSQSAYFDQGRRWLNQQVQVLQQFRKSVRHEESLSISEKLVRFLQARSTANENTNYNSIFLTKGYIGESFWIGRQEELSHIEVLIRNWQRGYRGSVAITGRRFSGKSLFGDLVANRYFPEKFIRLTPNSTLKVGGRSMQVTYDLAEALDFVLKYTLNTPSLVWLDDLELWWKPGLPLSQNVRNLEQDIDSYANRLFFMVSMSNWLKAHLDHFLQFDKVFQAEINVDRMGIEEIREAILIRHGATHKNLVDQNGEEITPQQFRKMTKKVAQVAEGTVGEALNIWSASTHKVDDERVMHRLLSSYDLPDFITPDTALLLSSIMLEKRTNEYRLRKHFGPAFKDNYGSILQRLLSIGLLIRQLDGWLEINEAAVNEVGRLLHEHQYIQFYAE